MSDKDWYTNLSRYELEGKHVHVLFSDGTMEGSLNLLGQIVYWNSDAGLKHVQILDWNKDRTWTRATGVESVSLMWDERDWEQVPLDKAKEGDYLVVGNSLQEIHCSYLDGPSSGYWDIDDEPMSHIYFDMASCALRKKSKLPTEPGFYRSDSDDFFYLTSDSEWWMVGPDDIDHLSLPPNDFLPLTPVHFMDVRTK